MSAPISKKGELPPVVVPPHLWMRSGRPGPGRALHYGVPLTFAAIGLTAETTAAKMSFIGVGLLLWVLIPALTQNALERIGRTIENASRRRAGSLLRTLRGRPLVSLFAPYAWVTLQEARLHLKLGDGKAAARAFAETARLCRQPDAVMLVSAQAHALVVAGDRKNARRLLNKLLKAKLVGPRDQLDLAIVLLSTSEKKARQALAYIEAARKTIGEHPRLVAAHALALLQLEKVDKASALLEKAQIYLQDDPDPVVDDLVRRGRHKHRRVIEGQLRRERRARSRRTTIVVTSETAVNKVVGGVIDGMSDGERVEKQKDEKAEEARRSLKARGWADPTEAHDAPIVVESDGPIHKQSVSYDTHGRRTFTNLRAVPEKPSPAIDIELDDVDDDDDLGISMDVDEGEDEQDIAVELASPGDESEDDEPDAPKARPSKQSALVDASTQTPSILEGSDLRRVKQGASPYAPPAPSPPDKGLFRSAPGGNGKQGDGARSSKLTPAPPPTSSSDSGRRPVFSPPKVKDGPRTRRPTLGSAFAVRQPGEAVPHGPRKREDSGDANTPR